MTTSEYASRVKIEAICGDIVEQPDIDVIVNAANAWLRSGGGVAGAIHRAAGSDLNKECLLLSPIRPGEAVITGAYRLPNKYIIHCLGPVYGKDKPEDRLLADCYRNALLLADKNGLHSIAFPAISTGVFGYPVDAASRVAISSISETIRALKNIRLIRMVLFSDHDLTAFQKNINQ